MARYMRGYGQAGIGAPVVIADAVIFRPVKVSLVGVRTPVENTRHNVQAVLRPPVVLQAGPPVVTKSRVTFAPRAAFENRRHMVQASIGGPVAVGFATIFRPVQVSLAGRTRAEQIRRAPHSILRPPATLATPAAPFTARPEQVHLLPARRQPATRRDLRAPAVVAAAVTFRPISIRLAAGRVQTEQRRRVVQHNLRPPGVVAPAVVFRAPDVTLTQPNMLRRRGTCSHLAPPAVVQPVLFQFIPLRVTLTTPDMRRRAPHPKPGKPAVVAPAVVHRPLQRTVVAVRTALENRRHDVQAILRPPTVVATPVQPPVVTVERITLAAGRVQTEQIRRAAHSIIRKPTVVAPAVIFRAIQLTLAPSKRGKPKSFLKPPAVLATPAPFRGPRVTLAPSKRGKPKSFLLPPAVIQRPVFPGPKTTLAPLTPSKRGRPKSIIRKPAVVAAATVFRAFTVRLGLRNRLEQERRNQRSSELRGPATQPIIIVTGPYDRPHPGGRSPGHPGGGRYDNPNPGGASPADPGAGRYDNPRPGQA